MGEENFTSRGIQVYRSKFGNNKRYIEDRNVVEKKNITRVSKFKTKQNIRRVKQARSNLYRRS